MHRRCLAATTAIAGFMAVPAYGQSLPGSGQVTGVVTNGSDPGVIRIGNTLNVSLNADNTIINWDGFNIPESGTANFDRGLFGPTGKIAVLNRDVSGNPSQLMGRLSSGSNVSVWVMNANGIMVGNRANITTGSLVLTTLDMADADFLDRNGSFAMTTTPGSQSAITVMNGARVRVAGGNRGLIMVAPQIDANGSFQTTDQDVAFVTASDVDLTFTPGSPLSVKINQGTAVRGRSQFVRGTVSGADVLFALASQASVTDALLQVDASVTTALSGTRGIILSSGATTSGLSGVSVVAGTGTSGTASVLAGADLSTTDSTGGSDILVAATGDASFTGVLSSVRDVAVTGGGNVSIAGAVSAGRDYAVEGRAVTLGGSGSVLQRADGSIAVTASRSLTGRSGLTLFANADGSVVGAEPITLRATFDGVETAPDGSTTASTPGLINFAPDTLLRGGTNRQSAVNILSGASGGRVALGNISARALLGAVGGATPTVGITRQAAITVGNLTLVDQVRLQGTTVTAGALSSGGAVRLDGTVGGVSTGTIDASAGVFVDAAAVAQFNGTINSGDDLVVRGTSVRLNGNATALGTIDLEARSGGISGATGLRLTSTSSDASDFIRLQAAGAQGIDLSSSGTILAGANRALRVAVRNGNDAAPLVLGDVSARALIGLSVANGDPGSAGAAIIGGGLLTFGNLNLVENFSARSTGGDLRIASIAVTGAGQGIDLAAPTGGLIVQSTISASGDVSLVGRAPLTLNTVESRNGRVSVSSDGALILNVLSGARGATANGGSVTIGSTTGGTGPVGITSSAGGVTLGTVDGGRITLEASGGDLFATGAVTARGALSANASGRTSFAQSIAVAGGGVDITAGASLRTGSVTADGPVSLAGGSVTYGSLSGTGVRIQAANGDVAGGDVASAGSIDAAAAGGGMTLGVLNATGPNGDVTLASAGGLSAASVTASGAARLTTSRADADIVLENGLSAQRAVVVTAGRDIRAPFIRSVAESLTVNAPNGSVGGFTGAGIALSAGPGKALSLTVANAVTLGNIGGGALSISAGSISIGAIDVGTSPLSLIARGGDLTVAGGILAGDTTLASTGRTSLGSVLAQGRLSISGAAALQFVNLAGTDVTLASNGAIAGDGIRATGALTSTGGSVALTSASAGAALGLLATTGDLSVDTVTGGGNVTIAAIGRAAVTGNVDAGGTYSVTGASVGLGNRTVTHRAGDTIAITSRGGDIVGASGLTLTNVAGNILFDSAGTIALTGSTVQTPGALGLRAGGGRSITLGGIQAGSVGGYDGISVAGPVRHSGSITAGDIVTGAIDVALSAGDITTGRITVAGLVNLVTRSGAISTGAVQGGPVVLDASGPLTAVSINTQAAATLSGSEIRTNLVRAGSIGIRAGGALGGIGGGRVSLTSTTGDITVNAGDMSLASVQSAGAIALDGNGIDIAGSLSAARQALIKARAALTMAEGTAGTDLTLASAGPLAATTLRADGAVTVTGLGIRLDNVRAGGAALLTSGADLTLGSGEAGGGTVLDATGLATIGALSAGPSILINAADVALTGVQRASTITVQNRNSLNAAMRLGDDTAPGGLRLSEAEIALLDADTVRFDQGAGALQLGTLSFGANTGRRTVDLLTTGAIDVVGTVSGTGLGRSFRIGGDLKAGIASRIYVTATGTAGGRLLFTNANLDLRGDRIAAGLAPGFIDTLTPDAAGSAQALSFISNGNSPLYNAALGGGAYDPGATTLVSAYMLTVRFGDFALFQNTGVPGQFSGVALGGTLVAPATPALSVRSTRTPADGRFAFFGTINGVGGSGASLLGSGIVDIDPGLLGTSRINGCLAGSGVGCLTTIVIQPVLQTFDWSSEDVFGVLQDVATPFDPGVGGNNEDLLSGLPALAPQSDTSDRQIPESPAK